MLNELYNKLKEDNAFRDLFKPISKEEMDKRQKKKWGHSDYDDCRAYEANVKGRFILTYDKHGLASILGGSPWDFKKEGGKKIAELLANAVENCYNLGMEEEEQVGKLFLNLSASKLSSRKIPDEFEKDRDSGFEIIKGVFSGTAIMVDEEEIDKSRIKDTIIEYTAISNEEGMWGEWEEMEKMEVSNVQVTNLKIIERKDMWKALGKYIHTANVEGNEEEEEEEKEKRNKKEKKEIDRRLKAGKCTLNRDGSYSCKGTVDFGSMGLIRLPVKFKEVKGDLDCSFNRIETLEGCPERVEGYFDCSSNKLTSLEGAPKYVGRRFDCSFNELRSLVGCPKEVGGNFGCDGNENLTSLKGLSKKVGGYIDIEDTPIAKKLGIDKIKGSELHKYVK